MTARMLNIAGFSKSFEGMPEYLGSIAATTTGVDNSNTGTPFTIPDGAAILIQADADVYLSAQATAAATPPATTASFLLASGGVGQFVMTRAKPYLCARTASGTATVKVFQTK